jgi:uncharacterized NAD(P)/FAD-binding protein YdhS
MAENSSSASDVVFIGGGPSAVAALGALLDAGTFRSATIVDPSEIGIGLVFGPKCAGDLGLLCNSPAGVTFTDDHNPDEFADFLARRGWPASTDDYTPRFLFGEFCRDKYLKLRAVAEARGIAVRQVRAKVETISRDAAGYLLALDDGSELRGTEVLVCAGLEAPILASLVAPYRGHPRLLHGTYPVERLRELPSGSHVLVLGMRSSAIDAAYVLSRAGHTAVLTSPSGRVSAVRDKLRIPPKQHLDRQRWLALDPDDPDIERKATELLIEAVTAAGSGVSVDKQIAPKTDAATRLGVEIALAEAEQTYWGDLVFDGIHLLNELVGAWDGPARTRLLPKAYELLTRYVNALPLLIANRLLKSVNDGSTRISAIFVESVVPAGEGWEVTWGDGRAEDFDAVVSATGYHFPRFPQLDDDTIRLTHAGEITPETRLAMLTPDLAFSLDGGQTTERIWAVGAATNQGFPLAHVIFLAARQSRTIAAQLFEHIDEREVTAMEESPGVFA